tara:strand:+ start:2315 stop:3271 length:957 start_codon:yes stop_codon:yes gene_type:complete
MGALKLKYYQKNEDLEISPVFLVSHLKGNTALREIYGKTYAYGFNGQERDDEISGSGNSYDFGSRLLDPRLGKWFTIDPQAEKYPYASPYSSFGNNPLIFIDPEGETLKVVASDPALYLKYQSVLKTSFNNKVESKISEDGTVTFHQVPNTKLTELEQNGLNALLEVTSSPTEVTMTLYDNNSQESEAKGIRIGSFKSGGINLDHIAAVGNDDNRQTSRGKIVHETIEQWMKQEYIDNGGEVEGLDNEAAAYDFTHRIGVNYENETQNFYRDEKRNTGVIFGTGDEPDIHFRFRDTYDENSNFTGFEYEIIDPKPQEK